MRTFILRVLFFLIIGYFLPGIEIAGLGTALVAAIVYGLLNFIVRPIFKILSLPINILTLGLFNIIINASIFYLTSVFYSGLYIDSFGTAIIGSLILSIIQELLNGKY